MAARRLLVIAGGAAALPGATVTIAPDSRAIGSRSYAVTVPIAGHATGNTEIQQTGTATGSHPELIPAKGSVTFSNWNLVAVEVPQGSSVSVSGDIAFGTDARIVVPAANFNGTQL